MLSHAEYSARQVEVREDCSSVFSASNDHKLTLFGIINNISVSPILCANSQELLEPSTRRAKDDQVISIHKMINNHVTNPAART